ncbi:MAG: hypothetical protein ACXWB9_11565 [Flavisolibacter sp.]
MKTIVIMTVLLFSGLTTFAQNFPSDFLGHWEGELQWYKTGNKAPQNIKMQLVIQKTDTAGTYLWKLVYGEQNTDNRPYLLKAIDTAKGHWVVDERNGILLDHYWVGNRLTGAFTVENTTILNSFRLEGDALLVEFYSTSAKPVRTSGGSSDIPSVFSYQAKAYQLAVLKKKKD